jgi:hypothetical protein
MFSLGPQDPEFRAPPQTTANTSTILDSPCQDGPCITGAAPTSTGSQSTVSFPPAGWSPWHFVLFIVDIFTRQVLITLGLFKCVSFLRLIFSSSFLSRCRWPHQRATIRSRKPVAMVCSDGLERATFSNACHGTRTFSFLDYAC